VHQPAPEKPEEPEVNDTTSETPLGGQPGDGVLAKAGIWMSAVIGLVAAAAMAEAGWNLGRFVLKILHLPFPLAVMFPLILESVAGTFAVQDLRDRRQGHDSPGMRAATYLTLVASSTINGVVGVSAYGPAGLLEVLPPLVLAAVIHLHGDRATRAHHSRAVHSPAWRAAQLRKAQVASVIEVLPLLAGDDKDGEATVDLLRRRLESCTLEPGEALLSAGWHDREVRTESVSRLRRLETVAATVWGQDVPPSPAPVGRGPGQDADWQAILAAWAEVLRPAPGEVSPVGGRPVGEDAVPAPEPVTDPAPGKEPKAPAGPSRRRPVRKPAAKSQRRPRVTGGDDILLPVAREVARDLNAQGKPVTRDALRDGIRAKGKSCANARAGQLLAAIRAA
jgi:hypothetical protein